MKKISFIQMTLVGISIGIFLGTALPSHVVEHLCHYHLDLHNHGNQPENTDADSSRDDSSKREFERDYNNWKEAKRNQEKESDLKKWDDGMTKKQKDLVDGWCNNKWSREHSESRHESGTNSYRDRD